MRKLLFEKFLLFEETTLRLVYDVTEGSTQEAPMACVLPRKVEKVFGLNSWPYSSVVIF